MNEILRNHEFKGQPLQAFSKGRLTLLQSAGVRFTSDPAPGPKDILAVVFICLCDSKTRAMAQMSPAAFWDKLEEWENKTIEGPEDYAAVSDLATALLNEITETKAEPMESGDLSQLPDPSPNLPSQTI